MTLDGEAAAAAAALGRPDHRRGRPGRRRLGLQPDRSGEDQPLPAHRGRAVAAAHPDPVRLRHDPRLPHDLPDPAGRREQLRPVGGDRRRHRRRSRDGDRRHQADLQPDGRRLARAALGPDLRGRRRGPVPRLRVRGGARQGRAGHRLLGARQGRHERQALRRLRPARGRPRVQHDRHVGAAAAQPLPAAVQGRDRRGRRHRDVLVQRDQRRARVRELRDSRRRRPQARVGLRRLHRERLHGRRRAARVPAEEPGHGPVRPRRRRRRTRRGCRPR